MMADFSEKNNAELPDDLIYSIFLMLPINSLVRFRSLSKQWNQIICSRRYSFDRPPVSNIIQSFVSEKEKTRYLFIHKNWADEFNRSEMKSYSPPIPSGLTPRWIAASTCDGLICGICINGNRNKTYNALVYIVIWNPHTRQHRVVPTPKGFRYNQYDPVVFRLGYDPAISDYKIVYLKRSGRAIQIFALKSNTWRTVNDASTVDLLGDKYIQYEDSVFVRGDVYCLWRLIHNIYSMTEVIVKFSLKEEKLTPISLPPDLKDCSDRKCLIKLGHYHDGSLCLFCYYFLEAGTERGEHTVETWLHQEDVVGDRAWKKVASIPDKLSQEIMRPLGYTRSGDLILKNFYSYGVYAYVPGASTVKKLKLKKQLKRKLLVDKQVQILDMETLISP